MPWWRRRPFSCSTSRPPVSTPTEIREVRVLLRELREDHAVLLSTHILPEVEASCDCALVIAAGALVAQGTLDELGRMREGARCASR